jgi:N-acetylglucosaminyldiphosphoundecaprenol N-acetyl-beta-D-mannosaminyltransferase
MGSMKSSIMGIPFDLIDYASTIEQIDWWRRSRQCRYVTLTNAHGVMLSRTDRELKSALRDASLVLPDGISIILAARMLGVPHRGRVTGPSLLLRLCQWGVERGYRHFFYGGAEGVADRLAERLRADYPGLQVAGTYSPPFRDLTDDEDRRIVQRINGTKPDVVWVGLGAPKQEKWMARHAGCFTSTIMIGVGAAFDFHSGNARWAPAWIRNIGCEWAFRLALDPRRMWRRNLGNSLFVGLVGKHALQQSLGLGGSASDAVYPTGRRAVVSSELSSRARDGAPAASTEVTDSDRRAA